MRPAFRASKALALVASCRPRLRFQPTAEEALFWKIEYFDHSLTSGDELKR